MPKKPAIYMETTEIPMQRTVTEVSLCLVQAGATTVSMKYEGSKIVGLTWGMRINGKEVHFAMPARVEPVYKLLCARRSASIDNAADKRIRAQAERVAWRQLLRWVQAQVAMIDVGMVQSAEVFMPYMTQSDGRTFFEYFESQQLRLPAAGAK